MSSFAYIGFEPDPLGGNNTQDRAGSGGTVGAFMGRGGTPRQVLEPGAFDGTVASYGGPVNDPVDFIRYLVGPFTDQIRIGTMIDLSGVTGATAFADRSGAEYRLVVNTYGASATTTVIEASYGSASLDGGRLQAYVDAMASFNAAGQRVLAMLQTTDRLSEEDTAAYYRVTELLGLVNDRYFGVITGGYTGGSIAGLRDIALARMDQLSDLLASVFINDSNVNAMRAAAIAAAQGIRPVIEAFYALTVMVNGRDVTQEVTRPFTDFGGEVEWLTDVATFAGANVGANDGIIGGPLLVQISGGVTVLDTEGGQRFEAIDYGFGVQTLARTYPNRVIVGDARANMLNGSARADLIQGQGGNDVLQGRGGKDRFEGGAGNDTLYGGNGADRLAGGDGNDLMFGGKGADILIGGVGKDVMTGGAGADTFVFLAPSDSARTRKRADVITDFTPGSDLIDLTRLGRTLDFIGTDAFGGTAGEVRFNAANRSVQIDLDGDGRPDMLIILRGVVSVGEGDFLL